MGSAVRMGATQAFLALRLCPRINAAREVTKTNTFRVETFQSPDVGVLGYVHEDQVTYYRWSSRRHTSASEFDVDALTSLPKVEILYSYLQPDTESLHDLIRRGARGVVFAGSGAGSLPERYKAAIRQARSASGGQVTAFVIASRVGSGRVIARTEYTDLGMVPADNLNPQKARILLMLALTQTTDVAVLRRVFREY